MERKFFVLSEGQVNGPYDLQEVERQSSQSPGSLIWGRGQLEWLDLIKWKKFLQDFEGQVQTQRKQNQRLWKVRASGVESAPMPQDSLIGYLKNQPDLNLVQIWTDGYTEWKDVFQIHKIMDELGVSRRTHPRVPIMGALECEGASGNQTVKAVSISENGLGVTDAEKFKIGEKFKVQLKSPNLYNAINATVEVVYVGQDGHAGLKFGSIHSESKSMIVEYVKKFSEVTQK